MNAVGPGIVDTSVDRTNQERPGLGTTPMRPRPSSSAGATPAEMIGPTLFLASDAASYVTGLFSLRTADGRPWTAGSHRPASESERCNAKCQMQKSRLAICICHSAFSHYAFCISLKHGSPMTKSSFRIAVIAGDGIGREVIPAGISAIEAVGARQRRAAWTSREFPWGCEFYLQAQAHAR